MLKEIKITPNSKFSDFLFNFLYELVLEAFIDNNNNEIRYSWVKKL